MEMTLRDLLDRTETEVLEHLDRQVTIPVVMGLQAQGDLLVVPIEADLRTLADGRLTAANTQVPPKGVTVLAGQHAHRLYADGAVAWAPGPDGQRLGWLRVARGAVAWLLHTEHGGSGIGEGIYVLRRQREMAQEQRLVQD